MKIRITVASGFVVGGFAFIVVGVILDVRQYRKQIKASNEKVRLAAAELRAATIVQERLNRNEYTSFSDMVADLKYHTIMFQNDVK